MTDFTLKDGRKVHLIGDPHLGKEFKVGVPPHRRGERELAQAAHFVQELDYEADIIISVGDLFDDPGVSRDAVLAAARACLAAAERNEDVTYIHMAGNHDQPRNLSSVGAWPLFRKMIEFRLPNLYAVDKPSVFAGVIALFPWEWDRRADEQLEDNIHHGIEHAVGHWDLIDFGKDDHLCPAAALREASPDVQVWSGHHHKAGVYQIEGVAVTCTGSMEPYAHGEGDKYVTLSREEALQRDDLYDKCVRILLQPGEDMPDIDCLALTHKRERDEKNDNQVTVSIDDFDFHRIVKERIQHRDPVVRSFIETRMMLNAAPAEEQC